MGQRRECTERRGQRRNLQRTGPPATRPSAVNAGMAASRCGTRAVSATSSVSFCAGRPYRASRRVSCATNPGWHRSNTLTLTLRPGEVRAFAQTWPPGVASAVEHVLGEAGDLPTLLGQGHELRAGQASPARVFPPGQGLEGQDFAAAEVDDGLQLHLQLPRIQCRAKFALHLHFARPPGRACRRRTRSGGSYRRPWPGTWRCRRRAAMSCGVSVLSS